MRPPMFSSIAWIASRRLEPPADWSPLTPSLVYEASIRYLGMGAHSHPGEPKATVAAYHLRPCAPC